LYKGFLYILDEAWQFHVLLRIPVTLDLDSKMMQMVVEVENLTKRYRGAKENAVDGISFSMLPHFFWAA